MGIFDGILICSDIDGTLTIGKKLVEKNIAAIEYFKDNGGSFTIATGRTAAYVKQMDFFPLINAPVCTCNGSVIYDFEKEKILRERSEDFTLEEFLSCISPLKHDLEGLYVYYTPYTIQADNMAVGAFSSDELCAKPIKIVCTLPTKEAADRFKEFCLKQELFKNTFISNSWDTGVEFNPIDGTKGSAIEYIKESLSHIHTSVGIGDWENDIPLLRSADLAVFVEGGLERLRPLADLVVCPAKDGAVAELIGKLELYVESDELASRNRVV